ncbi:MAG TPA: hypothetical protein VGJ56_08710 [Reyranella sp.]|jgi:hypothetical protein
MASLAHAQTAKSSTGNCGPETWSTDKMAYVGVPCSGAQAPGVQQASAPTSLQYCNALVARYDEYLNKTAKSGGMQSTNVAANVAAAKCRAGDTSDVGALEKALTDAQIALPPRS